jgi:hypothetical protein
MKPTGIVKKGRMGYNGRMKKCNRNPIIKYIRIALSLAVIGLGIYYKNWIGALGVLTLISAFTGDCALSLRFNRKTANEEEREDK